MISLAKWMLPLKIAGLVLIVGIVVNKGMMIERARWERALIEKNKEIKAQNQASEEKIALAETQRAAAIAVSEFAASTTKLGPELLPDDLVKKANAIR